MLAKLIAWGGLALGVLFGRSSDAAEKPIVAVFLMENRGSPLSADEILGLTDYLSTMLGEDGRFQMVPRDEIRRRLVDQKAQSYSECIDQSCQIEVGRELAAQFTVSSTISRVGPRCLITAALYDLRRAATLGTASSNKVCKPDELIDAVESISSKLKVVMGGPPKSAVECAADRDCADGRVCLSGKCAARAGEVLANKPGGPVPAGQIIGSAWQPAHVAPPAPAAVTAKEEVSTGWTFGAGITGLISAAAVLGLTLSAESNLGDQASSMSLGGLAVLGLAVMGPVTDKGGRSATGEDVAGSIGLRVGGWIAYGVSLSIGGILLLAGLAEEEPPKAMILSTGLVGAAALGMFAADAFIGYSQARSKMAEPVALAPATQAAKLAPAILPILSPDRHIDGAAFGLSGLW